MVYTLLEHLSDELLISVFEYLDAIHLYHAFSDLNTRFNHILNDSLLRLYFDSNSVRDCRDRCVFNRINQHQIISLTITSGPFLAYLKFHISTFINLQSIFFNSTNHSQDFLSELESLGKLRTLVVQNTLNECEFVRRIVFENELPQLRKFVYIPKVQHYSVEHVCLNDTTRNRSNNLEHMTIRNVHSSNLAGFLRKSSNLKYLNVSISDTLETGVLSSKLIYLNINLFRTTYDNLYQLLYLSPLLNLKQFELSGYGYDQKLLNGEKLRYLVSSLPSLRIFNVDMKINTTPSLEIKIATFENEKIYWKNLKWYIEGMYATLRAELF
ncbi:unnamed protein product [Didymodactylos carnosus]|uniref:F-box domain-containing protein n=1 Tax=Didymodactylos carnosus TaxID=1234261 RepID=A0A814WZQ2_9BILA|nr:unnamed protein product [Didymodactylos carnosus]CAF1204788.1 unnamed protein product [Didymodactylos carnosus]CAF3893443.1 unnamed protein product [Didymodactylos carnosus]CAF3969131.1 unnamed protein product [Didymodactylos carnosus]